MNKPRVIMNCQVYPRPELSGKVTGYLRLARCRWIYALSKVVYQLAFSNVTITELPSLEKKSHVVVLPALLTMNELEDTDGSIFLWAECVQLKILLLVVHVFSHTH